MPPAFDRTHAPTPLTAEEEVYRHLLHAICSGVYRAGARLKSADIAEQVGMSRMPVREAFRRLAAEGLLTLRPNRGAVVNGLDLDAMREIFEMRGVLEGLAIRLAAERCTARHLAVLMGLVDEMDAYRADSTEWVVRHRAFHEYLYGLAERPRLARQISSLHALIEPYMHLWLQHAPKIRDARAAHDAIVDALRDGSPRYAEHVMRDHIGRTIPALLAFMQAHETPSPRNSELPQSHDKQTGAGR